MTSPDSSDLIPRTKIFGNPSRVMCRISPDGGQLSWIAPKDNVLNLWVAPVDDLSAARCVTDDKLRGIRFYVWARNGTHLLYIQDEGGDEDWHVHSVDLTSDTTHDLTPIKGVNAQFQALSWTHADEAIIGLNDRDKSWHDLYRVNIATGERELLFLNNQDFGGFAIDRDLGLRLTEKSLPEGGRIIYRYDDGAFHDVLHIPYEDDLTTGIVGFEADGEAYYLIDSIGRDTAALVRVDWASNEKETLAEYPKADIGQIVTHPTTYKIEAWGANYLKLEWHALGPAIADDLDFLSSKFSDQFEFDIVSRTKDDQTWIVASSSAQHPGTNYLYERENRTLTKLFSSRPELEDYHLCPMHPHIVPARDGLELVSYLTLPAGSGTSEEKPKPDQPVPLVLLVHGGPWARDGYGYDPQHQWLANRGYGVLSVNFRGSHGFGKNFINAGNLEWGRKMHDDLIDAVQWAIDQGITTKDQVAIMGGSYGGYATLVGLTFTPDVFACGVDIVGPSNLQTLIETIPPYWQSFFENFALRMGDPRTEEGRKLLQERSPLNKADQISKPLLIGQGANDPRVKQAESDQIVQAMQDKNLAVTYVLYPDEGHGFARPENRMSFYAVAEAFLGENLGGRIEPIRDDFAGSSIEVREGADHIPGLKAALSNPEV